MITEEVVVKELISILDRKKREIHKDFLPCYPDSVYLKKTLSSIENAVKELQKLNEAKFVIRYLPYHNPNPLEIAEAVIKGRFNL